MSKKSPKAFDGFDKRVRELNSLERIAADIKKAKVPEIQMKTNILRNVELVFIVTQWETFIEELLREAVGHICASCSNPVNIPGVVQEKVSSYLVECKDKRKIWSIAGDNWKKVYDDYCTTKINGFNTPRPSNIDDLLSDCLGLKSCSKKWSWKGMSNSSILDQINKNITVRGEIIHQLNRKKSLSIAELGSFHKYLMRCGRILTNQLRDHVHGITSVYPWDKH